MLDQSIRLFITASTNAGVVRTVIVKIKYVLPKNVAVQTENCKLEIYWIALRNIQSKRQSRVTKTRHLTKTPVNSSCSRKLGFGDCTLYISTRSDCYSLCVGHIGIGNGIMSLRMGFVETFGLGTGT